MADEKCAIDLENQQAYYLQPQYRQEYDQPAQPIRGVQPHIIQPDQPPPAEYYANQGGLKINRTSTLYISLIQLVIAVLLIVNAILYVSLALPYNFYQDFWIGAFVLISALISLTAARRVKPGRGIISVCLALSLFCMLLAISGIVLTSLLFDWSMIFKEVCLGRRPDRYMRMWDWQKQEMLVKCYQAKIPYEYQWIFYMIDLLLFIFETILMAVLSVFYSRALCCRTSTTY
ncbi:uncharacterized protein LOC141914692 [Tubulanus polymorphus]|uniref:uncharacterized protein LOC141914692 n=1 Tax=Tubulanus polymorphus TaxID=672921 RepID=UPI003DA6B4CC